MRLRALPFFCLAALLCLLPGHSHAQHSESIMSEAEVDRLREAAYIPADRIDAFIKILDSRSKRVQDIVSKPRRPGREQDLHDLFDQFSGIADELNDNLDEYGPKHRDLRKALPKLLLATERWSTTLRAAPEDSAYKVVRKLALDAVKDIQDAATAMQTEQIAYFKAHPEAALAEKNRTENKPQAIEVPR